MQRKSAKSRAGSAKAGRRSAWRDPDDAPEITDDMLDRAEIVKGGKVIQRGRPPIGAVAKQQKGRQHGGHLVCPADFQSS